MSIDYTNFFYDDFRPFNISEKYHHHNKLNLFIFSVKLNIVTLITQQNFKFDCLNE